MVPQQAVSRDRKGNPTVMVVDEQDKVVQKQIDVDRAIGDHWYVTSGLITGDRIIVDGLQKVRPGMSVKAVAFEKNTEPLAANRASVESAE